MLSIYCAQVLPEYTREKKIKVKKNEPIREKKKWGGQLDGMVNLVVPFFRPALRIGPCRFRRQSYFPRYIYPSIIIKDEINHETDRS